MPLPPNAAAAPRLPRSYPDPRVSPSGFGPELDLYDCSTQSFDASFGTAPCSSPPYCRAPTEIGSENWKTRHLIRDAYFGTEHWTPRTVSLSVSEAGCTEFRSRLHSFPADHQGQWLGRRWTHLQMNSSASPGCCIRPWRTASSAELVASLIVLIVATQPLLVLGDFHTFASSSANRVSFDRRDHD